MTLYNAFLTERREAFDVEYRFCNVANRLPRVHTESRVSSHPSRSECGSDVGSSTSLVGTVVQKKSVSGLGSSAVTAVISSSGSGKSPVKSVGSSSKGGSKKPVPSSRLDATVLSKKSKKQSKRGLILFCP